MMRRILLVASFMLLVTGLPLPSPAVTDYRDPAITRLWRLSEGDDRFVCTASYVVPRINESVAWIVTAGHCIIGDLVKVNADSWVTGLVSWRGLLRDYGVYAGTVTDLAVGTVPDVRETHPLLWLANETPDSGLAYIHGFPLGIESIDVARIVPPHALDTVTVLTPVSPWDVEQKRIGDVFPGARFLLVKEDRIAGGSSGSPILDTGGRVIGVLWGGLPNSALSDPAPSGFVYIMFTPVERLHELFRTLGVS